MSRHRLVRNMDYEAELSDYAYSDEGEDELGPEDRALMTQGTADVIAALGSEASKVTKDQIEEALWHYYYDVDKSVTYLVSKFISPPTPRPPKTKPAPQKSKSKSATPVVVFATAFEGIPCSAEEGLDKRARKLEYTPTTIGPIPSIHSRTSGSRESLSHYFDDMPWGNIPKYRETVFIPPPTLRGGLLGGSGAPPKMSKLQALAAARKKKSENKSSSEEQVEHTQSQMKELSVSDDAPGGKENIHLGGPFSKRLKTSSSTAQGRQPVLPTEPRSEPLPQQIHQAEVPENDKPPSIDHAQPSAFAQTLFGASSSIHNPGRKNLVTLSLAPSVLEAFSKPSPDDIVLAAQAKGSLIGKKSAC